MDADDVKEMGFPCDVEELVLRARRRLLMPVLTA